MNDSAQEPPEYDDDAPRALAASEKWELREYTLNLARSLYEYSVPQVGGPAGGVPAMSPEEAFTHAEAFVAEAIRRGY